MGINSRLDTLQAAVLLVKLKRLEDWTAQRKQKAAFCQLFSPPVFINSVFHNVGHALVSFTCFINWLASIFNPGTAASLPQKRRIGKRVSYN
jgi:dTDP-4-amino-4,6-dideoxygalactose transaminase